MKKQEEIKNRLREIIANKGQCGHNFITGCSIPCAIKAADGNCIMRVPNAWDGKERTPAEWDARRYQTMHKIAVEALQDMLIRKKISPLDIVGTRHNGAVHIAIMEKPDQVAAPFILSCGEINRQLKYFPMSFSSFPIALLEVENMFDSEQDLAIHLENDGYTIYECINIKKALKYIMEENL